MFDKQTYKGGKGCTEEFCVCRFRVSLVVTKERESTLYWRMGLFDYIILL